MTDKFAIECKTMMTEKKSMSIKKEWIEGIKEEAFAMGKEHWAIAFNFGGSLQNSENYYIISEDDFKQFINYLEEE